MIVFKNKEFIGGDILDIIYFNDIDNVTIDNWWENPLKEECWILEIPKNVSDIQLFNARLEGIEFIPRDYDEHDKNRKIFWDSNETFVFGSFEKALNYMCNYEGSFEPEVEDFYEFIIQQRTIKDAYKEYLCLCDIDEFTNEGFFGELVGFIESKNLSSDTILTTMKSYILYSYKVKIEEQRLSRLN